MKLFALITCVAVSFVIGTAMSHDTSNDMDVTFEPSVFEYISMTIAEYPSPFLNMGGELKYHVMINGQIVGMHDEDAQMLLDTFKVTPIPASDFHNSGLDHQIWAFRRSKIDKIQAPAVQLTSID